MRLQAVIVVGALVTGGCEARDARVADSVAAKDTTAAGSTWPQVVTDSGVGALRIGMSEEEALVSMPGLRIEEPLPGSACAYARSPTLPNGVSVMFEDGTLARIDVDSSTAVTEAGARIGDPESRINAIYGGRVVKSPHKYTDGNYLTVVPGAGTSAETRIVFETNGRVVTRWRVGKLPEVEYVEGCS
jgi:hypothetical protein